MIEYALETPTTAANLFNDRVIPFFESNDVNLLPHMDRSRQRVLRQSGAARARLYLAVEDIDHLAHPKPMLADNALEIGEVETAARTLGLEVATSGNPESGGYCARIRGAQGTRIGAICLG